MLAQCSQIIKKIHGWMHQLYVLPPKASLKKITAKLAGQRHNICTDEIFEESPKYIQPQRMTNFFWRYETIVRRARPEFAMDFDGKKVLEIGGGPMLGWGLYAIFMGCARYVCVEPEFNPSLLDHSKAKYFFWLTYKDLSALFGQKMSYTVFDQAIRERIVVYRTYIEDFSQEDGFDIVLSNSTLEHIHNLDAALMRLRAMMSMRGRFLHVVDFGNHRDKMNPLGGLYAGTPEQYWGKYGSMITLKKSSDILKLLEQYGFPAQLIPYYSLDAYPEHVDYWWKERYTKEDLLLKVGIFVNKQYS